MTYAVIDMNGVIVNRIVLDDVNAWSPGVGYTIQQEPPTGYAIGGTFINGVYTGPISTPIVPATFDPIDTWDLVSLKIAFNHENRFRALEGKPAITVTQFKTAIRLIAS